MQPLPYVHAGAGIAFYVVLGVFLAVEQRIRFRSLRDREGRGTGADAGTFYVLVCFIAAGIGGAFVFAGTATGAAITIARWPLFIAGMALIVAGVALRQWAISLLGRFFTVDVRVREGQTVVDTGPYRVVRHPSYTAMVMIFVGIGLALGNWLSLACAALLPLPGLVIRIRAEERALLAGIGGPYRAFAATRRRLLPGVW